MPSYEYNGKTYFFALGRWVNEVNRPVPPDIAQALSEKYPRDEVNAIEKDAQAKRAATIKKNAKAMKSKFRISSDTMVSGAGYNPNWHRKAKERPYDGDHELREGQKKALEILESGENVFLTGEAGTGKSYVLNEFLHRNSDKNIIVCAFTGIAAINVGGSTLHRVFKAPIGAIKPGDYNKNPSDVVVKADTVIIDEISMCRIDLFEYVIRTIRQAEKERQVVEDVNAMEAGRIPDLIRRKQIIVVGDFYQLSPVIGSRDEAAFYSFWDQDKICDGFAFASPLWDELGFKNVVLKEVIRQSGDLEYIENLNKIRIGDTSGASWFNEHVSRTPQKDAIYLCGTNATANAINDRESDALPGEPVEYVARSSGTVNDGDKMTNDVLSLKVGMQVMTLVNEMNNQYQNGSIGRIVAMFDDHVNIKLNNGKTVSVVRYEWEINGFEVHGKKIEKIVLGNFKQLPLKVAYAITIHKSQGQTYSNVNILPECFASGQLYVALSRAKSSAGMSFEHIITPGSLRTNPHVKRFYDRLSEETVI